jgi:8-oxo-dGTP pyrophosphatase MutT (NUDIX family)
LANRTGENVKTRDAVRLIVLDADRRILLLRVQSDFIEVDGARPMRVFWITPGGGLETDETPADAAPRELLEETGLRPTAPPWPLWYGEQVLVLHGEERLFRETFMLYEVQETALSTERQTEEEKKIVKEMRWWTLAALQESTELIYPRNLAALVAPIVQGERPTQIEHISFLR